MRSRKGRAFPRISATPYSPNENTPTIDTAAMLATATTTATHRAANSGIARRLKAGQYAFARAACSDAAHFRFREFADGSHVAYVKGIYTLARANFQPGA